MRWVVCVVLTIVVRSLFYATNNTVLCGSVTTGTGDVYILNVVESLNTTASGGTGAGGGVGVVAKITTGATATGLSVISPDGTTLYVVDALTTAVGQSSGTSNLYKINLLNYTVTSYALRSGNNGRGGICITPDGSKVFVASAQQVLGSAGPSYVDLFTVATGVVSNFVDMAANLGQQMDISGLAATNTYLYVSGKGSGISGFVYQLLIANPLSGPQSCQWQTGNGPNSNIPAWFGLNPSSNNMYIENTNQTGVYVGAFSNSFNFTTASYTTSIGGNGNFNQVCFGSSGYAYSANYILNPDLATVSTFSGLPSQSIVGSPPYYGPGITPSKNIIYLGDVGTSSGGAGASIHVINASTNAYIRTFSLPSTYSNTNYFRQIQIASTPITTSSLPITAKFTSSPIPGGAISFNVTNNTSATVYVTVAAYKTTNPLASSNATSNWLSSQTYINSYTLTVSPNTSLTNQTASFQYPSSGGFQVDLYQGNDIVFWSGAPVSGIVPINLFDAQYKYP